MVAYLTDRGGDRDEKDAILRFLVRAVQQRTRWSEQATALLWLGLWPALDAIYGRNFCHFQKSPSDLVSEIAARFTAVIQRADLTRINRLAATLAMNTERDLKEGLRRARTEERRLVGLPEDDDLDEARDEEGISAKRSSPNLTSEPAVADEIGAARAWLLPLAGADTDLVLSVVILGEDQHEAADRLGISHGAARKRYQRALERVRKEIAGGVSHPAFQTRVFSLRDAERPGEDPADE